MLKAISTYVYLKERLHPGLLDGLARGGAQAIEIFAARQHFDYANRKQHVREIGDWFHTSGISLHSLHSPMFADYEGGRAGFGTIVSARSGETEDTSIVHLAIGWGAGQLKVGSFARSERMAKWNEALRIQEALGSKARFAGLDEMPMRRRATKPVETSSGWRV